MLHEFVSSSLLGSCISISSGQLCRELGAGGVNTSNAALLDCLYNFSPITMATPTETVRSTARAIERRATVMATSRLLLFVSAKEDSRNISGYTGCQ